MRIFKRIVFFIAVYLLIEELGFAAGDVDSITRDVGSKIVTTVKTAMNFIVPVAGVFGGVYVGTKWLNGDQDAGKHLMMFAIGYALLWGIQTLI